MKKYLLFFTLFILSAFAVFGQVTPQAALPANINPALLDFSEARFFFLGPMDLYVEGLRYGNAEATVVLKYDGAGNFSVEPAPSVAGDLPNAIDFSSIKLLPRPDSSLKLTDLVINNYYWTGILRWKAGSVINAEGFSPVGPVPAVVPPEQTAQINRLQNQVAALNTQVEELKKENREIPLLRKENEEIPLLRKQVENLNAQVAGLESDVNKLNTRNKVLEGQVKELSTRSMELEGDVRDLTERNIGLDGQIKDLNAQVQTLNRNLSERNIRIADLQNRLSNSIYIKLPKLERQLASGFAQGKPVFGGWSLSGSALQQQDSDQYFAKYVIPVEQKGNEFIYTFRGSSDYRGWLGLGLHFLASGSSAVNGYGYGSSYMIWLTRDPKNQTQNSFIQLYQSFDDVHMIQIASAAIPFNIKEGVEATVYVNRLERVMKVFVNGFYAFTFPMEKEIPEGSYVVLRGLGRIKFEALKVWGN